MHFFAHKWISFRLLKFGIWQKRNVLHDWQVFDAFRKQRVVQWDIPLCVYTGLAFFRRLWTLPGRDSSLLFCPLKNFILLFFWSKVCCKYTCMYSDNVGNPRPASHTQAKSMHEWSGILFTHEKRTWKSIIHKTC